MRCRHVYGEESKMATKVQHLRALLLFIIRGDILVNTTLGIVS